jgi:hypothetical protein
MMGGTVNTMNLEALNQRQNDRLKKMENQQFDFGTTNQRPPVANKENDMFETKAP